MSTRGILLTLDHKLGPSSGEGLGKIGRRGQAKLFNYFNKLLKYSPKEGEFDLICEKILDFLNALPYILPEIFDYSSPLIWNNS